MNRRSFAILAVSATAALVFAFLLYPRPPSRPALQLLAGAGLRPAVEKLIAAFAAETGILVEPDYGGSGLILARARETECADLFLPGDAWYVDRLQTLRGNVAQRAVAAYFVPTIIVARGNPRGVTGLADLARPDLRVGLGKAEACQVGRVSAMILAKAGIRPAETALQESLTVNELGVWVKMKTVDAAIVWDAIAAGLADDVDCIAIPSACMVASEVVLARLTTSREPQAADRFLAFVTGDRGQAILGEAGYCVALP